MSRVFSPIAEMGSASAQVCNAGVGRAVAAILVEAPSRWTAGRRGARAANRVNGGWNPYLQMAGRSSFPHD